MMAPLRFPILPIIIEIRIFGVFTRECHDTHNPKVSRLSCAQLPGKMVRNLERRKRIFMVNPVSLLLQLYLLLLRSVSLFACFAWSVKPNHRNSAFSILVLLVLPSLLSCAKSENPLKMHKHLSFSGEVLESIRQDLGIPDSEILEVLDFGTSPPQVWGQAEYATILKSTDGKFQLARVTREMRSTMSRWSIYHIDILLIDGSGDVIVFEREFDHRPNANDLEEFEMWQKEW